MPETMPRQVGDLFLAKEILADDIDAAVTSYLTKPSPGPVALGDTYVVDVDAAIKAYRKRVPSWPDESAPEEQRRAMVKAAIIMAMPEKA